MYKVGKKILLLLAVFTVIAHSIYPHIHLDDIMAMVDHHHHSGTQANKHHQHDSGGSNEEHHNLFSFAQLDEDFIPAKVAFKKNELSVQYFLPVAVNHLFDFPVYTKQYFGWYKEYPPPDHYRYNLPSRAPPALYLS